MEATDSDEPKIHTLIFDEKPGIQAIGTTAPDLPPTEENGVIKRDYEYKRFGTLALLAAIDLITGKAFPLVSDTHKSSDFIEFLKMLDAFYPEGDIIRLVLDNLAGSTGIRKHGRTSRQDREGPSSCSDMSSGSQAQFNR